MSRNFGVEFYYMFLENRKALNLLVRAHRQVGERRALLLAGVAAEGAQQEIQPGAAGGRQTRIALQHLPSPLSAREGSKLTASALRPQSFVA